MPYPECGELPHHLKDIQYLLVIAQPKLSKMTEEMPEEIKQLRCEFESAWNHLKNAIALEYDGVYSFGELKMSAMRATVKQLHNQLAEAGWEVTDLI